MKVDIDKMSIESLKEILKTKEEEKKRDSNKYLCLDCDAEWDSLDCDIDTIKEIYDNISGCEPYASEFRLFKVTDERGVIYICKLKEE